jgi:hypothetical protein
MESERTREGAFTGLHLVGGLLSSPTRTLLDEIAEMPPLPAKLLGD